MQHILSRLCLLILLATLLLAGCGTNTNLTEPPDGDVLLFGAESTLEVMTWNLRTFPLSDAGVQTISQIIPKFKADIIAFQEIMDYNAFYTLADLIPNYYALVYNATSSYRLAYLYDTRTVQVDTVYTIYEDQDNPFPRPPYILEATWQGIDLVVINNHFKAYGNNHIDETDPWDEEMRRRLACEMLDQYVAANLDERRVIVLGDLNDQIAEPEEYNVFLSWLDKPDEYLFTDMHIAQNPSYGTISYPSSMSHIDHILISNELFDAWSQPGSECRVIRVEDYLGTWQNYYDQVSDHRPLGLKLQLR